MLTRKFIRSLFLLIVTGIVVGCSSGDPLDRQAVSGTVTFAGQPLDRGSIEFAPAGPETKTSGGAVIENGQYSIPAEQGLPPGSYTVRISSAGEAGGAADEDALPGESMQIAKERIPAQFNVNSTLEADIKSGEENVFDFDLEESGG